MKKFLERNFNREITYKSNGYTFIKGKMIKNNLKWNENIDKDGFHSSFININDNIKHKKDIININNWLYYCNYNNVHDITIYMNNPNINVLSKYLEPVKISSEELYIKNISINYNESLYNFFIKNTKMNNDIKIKNQNNNNIYGLRSIKISSFQINEKNYNSNKILNIIHYSQILGFKPLFIYNDMEIIKDCILKYNIDRMYNININILDFDKYNIFTVISNKINNFNNSLYNYYGKEVDYNYVLNIYIKWEHFIEKYENENIINKLNNDISKLKQTYKFKINIYIPSYIKYLIGYNLENIIYYYP